MSIRLINAGAVERPLGFWASFHDAEILTIVLDREGTALAVRIRLHTRTGHHEVALRFQDVENLVLEHFNHQNVIRTFRLSPITEERFMTGNIEEWVKVEIDSVVRT